MEEVAYKVNLRCKYLCLTVHQSSTRSSLPASTTRTCSTAPSSSKFSQRSRSSTTALSSCSRSGARTTKRSMRNPSGVRNFLTFCQMRSQSGRCASTTSCSKPRTLTKTATVSISLTLRKKTQQFSSRIFSRTPNVSFILPYPL